MIPTVMTMMNNEVSLEDTDVICNGTVASLIYCPSTKS